MLSNSGSWTLNRTKPFDKYRRIARGTRAAPGNGASFAQSEREDRLFGEKASVNRQLHHVELKDFGVSHSSPLYVPRNLEIEKESRPVSPISDIAEVGTASPPPES
jgi:hypothetical protein